MSAQKVEFCDIPWHSPVENIYDKSHQVNDKRLRLVEYARNMAPHWCSKGHVGYMLAGRMEIETDNETVVYNAGDGVYLPAGEQHRHKARILTDVVRVFFVEEA